MPAIRSREVLKAVLVEVLSKHPNGLRIQDAYDTVAATYEFPEDWHRQIPGSTGYDELAKLGYSDWRQIAQETLVTLVPTEPQWQNEMRWARNDLREEGILDGSAPRGIWRLSELGSRIPKEDLLARLNTDEQSIVRTKRQVSEPRAATPQNSADNRPPATFRESLERKLETLTSSMPLEDLELLVEIARVIRTRSLTKTA